jgi:hypothetical protein
MSTTQTPWKQTPTLISVKKKVKSYLMFSRVFFSIHQIHQTEGKPIAVTGHGVP